MKTVLLGLGANLGDRLLQLKLAVEAISKLSDTRVLAKSRLYETEPMAYVDQPMFLNMVLKIETKMQPLQILGACLGIEAALGRERSFKNAPRNIDIDVLLYEDEKINTKELCLPHPRMHERAFVLAPLKDIYPDLNMFSFSFLDAYNKLDKNSVNVYNENECGSSPQKGCRE